MPSFTWELAAADECGEGVYYTVEGSERDYFEPKVQALLREDEPGELLFVQCGQLKKLGATAASSQVKLGIVDRVLASIQNASCQNFPETPLMKRAICFIIKNSET